MRYISNDNPFGLNPADPNGRDNYLIDSPEVHLPLNRPVGPDPVARRAARLYVPPFRARMNMVPGMVVHADPGRALRHPVRAALRIGHAGMRGVVVVETKPRSRAGWRSDHVRAAADGHVQAAPAAAGGSAQRWPGDARGGQGASPAIPWTAARSWTWKGLYGKTETMADGSTAKVDEAYLRAFIRNPTARVVKGFSPIMPHFDLSEQELSALVAYYQGARRDSRQHRGPALAERTQQTEHTP